MREISTETIVEAVRSLAIETNSKMGDDMVRALEQARDAEESPVGQDVLGRILENQALACREGIPLCQDTGYAVLFVELGQDVRITGGSLREAIDEGVRRGYREGYLRKSMVHSPIHRVNTGDNTPAIVHFDIVPGEILRLRFLVKGVGCDNMSRLAMLTPADGLEGMKRFVIKAISEAGPNPSPPLVVGIGLGGSFAQAALLANKALTRPVGEPHPHPDIAALERELLDEINALGIGPAGFGGTVTALAVHIEKYATHIGAFPVAMNLDCHSHRCRIRTL